MIPPEVRELLGRARREIDAARALVADGFAPQSTVHAYYAAFFAAEGALLVLGETRSKHSGVISAFGQLVVKTGGVDRAVGSTLRHLFELRNDAVYDTAGVTVDAASAAIAAAERFVVAVEEWMHQRSGS